MESEYPRINLSCLCHVQLCLLWNAVERSFTAVLMGPASPSAGAVMGIKTAKMAVMKQTAKASRECVIPRQSLLAKAQVSLPGVPQNQLVCTDRTFISCTDLQLYFLLVFCITYSISKLLNSVKQRVIFYTRMPSLSFQLSLPLAN